MDGEDQIKDGEKRNRRADRNTQVILGSPSFALNCQNDIALYVKQTKKKQKTPL